MNETPAEEIFNVIRRHVGSSSNAVGAAEIDPGLDDSAHFTFDNTQQPIRGGGGGPPGPQR